VSARDGAAGPLIGRWLRRACRGAIFADRLVRTTYFGLTTTHLLLGAALAAAGISPERLALLVLLAACFHVHIFLMNDVIDLEVDATAPRRANHPLVLGLRGEGVSRRSALAIAWLAALLSALLCAALRASPGAWLALGAAFGLIGVYNVYGKHCPVPPVTDAIQGLGWWGLVWFGALAIAPRISLAEIADRGLPLFAFSMGFTVLITGIHGGLRDLVNDAAHGRTNTALFLGALPSAPGAGASDTAVRSSPAVAAYAGAVLVLMFWPCVAFLGDPAHFRSEGTRLWTGVAVALVFAANCALSWRVVKPREPRRDAWMSAHSVVLLSPPLVLYLPSALLPPRLAWLVAGLFVVPLCFQSRFAQRLLARLDREDAPAHERQAALGERLDATR
jgi:4-hydroxybenzoate polyprenyltransferase